MRGWIRSRHNVGDFEGGLVVPLVRVGSVYVRLWTGHLCGRSTCVRTKNIAPASAQSADACTRNWRRRCQWPCAVRRSTEVNQLLNPTNADLIKLVQHCSTLFSRKNAHQNDIKHAYNAMTTDHIHNICEDCTASGWSGFWCKKNWVVWLNRFQKTTVMQWRQLHRTRGARAPTFINGWARGAPWVEEQQTRNWPNCIDHHESVHQND